MVLLHGWPQTSRAFARVVPALARTHMVVDPDLRGTGDSVRPEDGYAKTNQAADIRGILDAVNLTGPIAVAGPDIGSMIALAWAASRPEDISHLVLVDPLLPGLGLEEAMNVAEGGMWHFGFFMAPDIPEMLEVRTAGSECTVTGSEVTVVDGTTVHLPLPHTTILAGPHRYLTVTNTVTCRPGGDHGGGYGNGGNGSGVDHR
ncbi:alpha/beta fold hydrolase [Streptomyces griseofuscus]|uniref:alpha/beta fold hydrolase n=1 Tax=Streptomyces griseofuscus TaxID=146922 RepID=UPI0036780FA7